MYRWEGQERYKPHREGAKHWRQSFSTSGWQTGECPETMIRGKTRYGKQVSVRHPRRRGVGCVWVRQANSNEQPA